MKPHVHAEIIKQWADGAEIEWRRRGAGSEWWAPITEISPEWYESNEYRVKPSAPVIKTTMTDAELQDVVDFSAVRQFVTNRANNYRAVANAAIARAVVDGQVVPYENIKEAFRLGQLSPAGERVRADRDMAVAKAVRDATIRIVNEAMVKGTTRTELDLAAIIAEVTK